MTAPDSRRPKVLVVDDDHSIRQLVCTIVQRERFMVDCAADGAEAIELLKTNEYSVILLDLMMPRVDGFGVIEYLKTHAHGPKPIVIVITAYADQKFKEVDPTIVAGVIRKPFEVADLGNLVRLCATGFQKEVSHTLKKSSDRGIRDFAHKRQDAESQGDEQTN
jgi:two-component system chemotaxis response regulator CheY